MTNAQIHVIITMVKIQEVSLPSRILLYRFGHEGRWWQILRGHLLSCRGESSELSSNKTTSPVIIRKHWGSPICLLSILPSCSALQTHHSSDAESWIIRQLFYWSHYFTAGRSFQLAWSPPRLKNKPIFFLNHVELLGSKS